MVFKAKNSHYGSLWSKIADIVLKSEKGEIPVFMDSCKSYHESPKRYSKVPFYYEKIDKTYVKRHSVRKLRRGACDVRKMTAVTSQKLHSEIITQLGDDIEAATNQTLVKIVDVIYIRFPMQSDLIFTC